MVSVDDEADCQQLIRALQEIHPTPPLWRRHRPQMLPDAAHFFPSDPEKGTLTLRYSPWNASHPGCMDNSDLVC